MELIISAVLKGKKKKDGNYGSWDKIVLYFLVGYRGMI
jgi:hypothetical protein